MIGKTTARRMMRGRDAGRRGVAMLIAVGVLAALFLLAVPFAVFMRLQHSSSTQAVNTARARAAETGARSHARTVLYRGLSSLEGPAQALPFTDPNVDTLWEFHVTLRTTVLGVDDIAGAGGETFAVADALGLPNDNDPDVVDGYLRVDNEWMAYSDVQGFPGFAAGAPLSGQLAVQPEHRGLFGTVPVAHGADAIVSVFPSYHLWSIDIADQQARININTAPYRVILNLIQVLGIGAGDAARQQYIAWAISSYKLYGSFWEDFDGSDDIPDGTYTPFQNVSMLKNTSAAPLFRDGTPPTHDALSAAEFDLLRPHITVHAAHTGTDPWMVGFSMEGQVQAAPPGGAADTLPVAVNLQGGGIPGSRVLPGVGVASLLRFADNATPPNYELRLALARNQDTFLGADIDGVQTTIPIADATGFQMVPGAIGYLRIVDPINGNEWISYTGVDTSVGPPELTGVTRGIWGTAAVGHLVATPNAFLDGCVVSWDHPSFVMPPLPGLPRDNGNTEIAVEERHAININTVDDPVVLSSLLVGVSDGTDTIDPGDAAAVGGALLGHTSGGDGTYFEDNEDWFDGLDAAGNPLAPPADTPRGELDAEIASVAALGPGEIALLQGALDTDPANWPAVSTVPLRFNSGTLIGLESLGVADNLAGTPVAQSPRGAGIRLGRVYDVVPPLEPIWWILRSQEEFDTHVADNPGPNTQLLTHWRRSDLPPPADDPDYIDTDLDIGTVSPPVDELTGTVYTLMLEGLHGTPADFDLDAAAGTAAEQSGVAPDIDNVSSGGFRQVRLTYLTDYDQAAGARNVEADDFHATLQPFAVDFWIRAGEDASSRQFILDVGQAASPDDLNAANQARLYLENGQVVLRLDDQVAGGGFGGYAEARTSLPEFEFQTGEWHHVAVAAVGTFADEIAFLVDGIYDENMEWEYHYLDGGAEQTVDDAGVEEGYLWPVAAPMPLSHYTTSPGPGPNQEWLAGSPEIGLLDITGLPDQGCVAIDGADHPYEYDGFGSVTVNIPGVGLVTYPTLLLVSPLGEIHFGNEPVTVMIPLVQPAAHKPQLASPRSDIPEDGDNVAFWGYTDTGTGFWLAAAAPIGPTLVERVLTSDSTDGDGFQTVNFPQYYYWLVYNPQTAADPVVAGAPGNVIDPALRWKAFDHDDFVSAPAGVLAGVMPSGPIGNQLSVCADRAGAAAFEGELDELRVTTLPVALVSPTPTDWLTGQTDATVLEWAWSAVTGRALLQAGAVNPAVPAFPLHPTGGYFMLEGELYSYTSFTAATGLIDGIAQVRPDLVPTGVPGLAVIHTDLHRLVPLNFVASTRVAAGDFPAGADEDIPVVDASQFPDEGYVQVGSEIVGYSGRDTAGFPHRLLRTPGAGNVSSYPRGAYNTGGINGALHGQDSVVRHLPVRYPDRYRAEVNPGTWDVHQLYDDPGQLVGQMGMFSFNVDQPGQLRRVWWRFKDPLEDNQKVAVLVMIDDDVPWNTDPQDTADERISGDLFWGTLSDTGETDELSTFTTALDRPTVTSKVEVRFYFDLSETHAYNIDYAPGTGPVPDAGWSNMVQLDTVALEMVPESMTF